MSVLTPKERERFAAWLESEAATDDMLIEQLEKLPMRAVVIEREKDAAAKRRIARQLRATDSVEVPPAPPEVSP